MNPVAEVRAIMEASQKVDEPETDVIEDEPIEEIEGEADKPVDDPVEEVEEVEEVEQPESDTSDTYTPKEFAEAIGWDAKDVYDAIMIPLDDGGEAVSIGDLKNNHQNLIREHTKLQGEFKAKQEESETTGQGMALNQQMSNEMITIMGRIDAIDREMAEVNWAELEEIDPAAAVLKRQKFMQSRTEAENTGRQIHQYQENQRQQTLQQASIKMLELIPTWSDGTARKNDQDIISSHMQGVGFSTDEIASIDDPRVMVMLKELIDLRAEKTAATNAVKRVRQAPRAIKGRGAAVQKQDVTEKLVNKARSTGKKGDELNAVKAILKGRAAKM